MTKVQFLTMTSILLLAACSPKVYVIDRQTVLEQEAAGSWPEFDRDVIGQTAQAAPTPFSKVKDSVHRERLYNVLNGELADESVLGVESKK